MRQDGIRSRWTAGVGMARHPAFQSFPRCLAGRHSCGCPTASRGHDALRVVGAGSGAVNQICLDRIAGPDARCPMPDAGAGGDAPRWSQAPRIRIRTHPQAATPACSQRPVRSLSRAAVGSRRQRLDHAGNTATQLVTFSPVTSWVAVLTSPSRRSRSGRRAAATCPARRHLAAPTRDVPGRARPARCPPVSATYDAGPRQCPAGL